ncbi:hypothetical protein F5146DRAFT_185306 [Armillaria mellea]|nr:hypothetical protein F5146DRAFT_185306 [Armillaria mellea]
MQETYQRIQGTFTDSPPLFDKAFRGSRKHWPLKDTLKEQLDCRVTMSASVISATWVLTFRSVCDPLISQISVVTALSNLERRPSMLHAPLDSERYILLRTYCVTTSSAEGRAAIECELDDTSYGSVDSRREMKEDRLARVEKRGRARYCSGTATLALLRQPPTWTRRLCHDHLFSRPQMTYAHSHSLPMASDQTLAPE